MASVTKLKGLTKEEAGRRGFFVQAEEIGFVIINGEKIFYSGEKHEIVLEKEFYITDLKKPMDHLKNLYIKNISGELNGIFFDYNSYSSVPWADKPFSDFPNCGWMDLKKFEQKPERIATLLCFTLSSSAEKLVLVSFSEAVDITSAGDAKIMGKNRLLSIGGILILSIDGKDLFEFKKIRGDFYLVFGKVIHILPETILNMQCPNPVNYLKIHENETHKYFYNSSGIERESKKTNLKKYKIYIYILKLNFGK